MFTIDRSASEPDQKHNCHWCGSSLQRLRVVYKGKDSQRHYCSTEHLAYGEERALRYKAALAGQVC